MPFIRPEEEIRRLMIFHPRKVGKKRGVLPIPTLTPTPTVTATITPTITPTPTLTPTPSTIITFYLQTAGGDDLQTAGGDNILWTV